MKGAEKARRRKMGRKQKGKKAREAEETKEKAKKEGKRASISTYILILWNKFGTQIIVCGTQFFLSGTIKLFIIFIFNLSYEK